jgi:thiol-disulfide isomerase/thioredoxin
MKFKKSSSRLLFFFIFLLAFALSSYSQDRCPYKGPPQPSRTSSSYVLNFTITDTEGNTYDLYETLDSGKTVFIDLFFTQCFYCQQYAPIIEEIYQNTGAGEGDILMWGISNDPYDTDPIIDQYKADHDITNPCAGPQGGGIQAYTTIIAGQNFQGWPTYCVICPDRNMFFDPVYPPTVTGFDPYFEQCEQTAVGMEGNTVVREDLVIEMYPNPVKEVLTLELLLSHPAPVSMELVSLAGVSVMNRDYQLAQGSTTLSIDVSLVPPGYYILKMKREGIVTDHIKVIVQ